jgi:hypothetical protein
LRGAKSKLGADKRLLLLQSVLLQEPWVSAAGSEDRLAISLQNSVTGSVTKQPETPQVAELLSGSGEPNRELAVSDEGVMLLSRSHIGDTSVEDVQVVVSRSGLSTSCSSPSNTAP